jgi:hypothetical protein
VDIEVKSKALAKGNTLLFGYSDQIDTQFAQSCRSEADSSQIAIDSRFLRIPTGITTDHTQNHIPSLRRDTVIDRQGTRRPAKADEPLIGCEEIAMRGLDWL